MSWSLMPLVGSGCGRRQRPFLSCGAGRKPTVRDAAIVIGALVRGLKPARALRRRTENVPKPGTQKRLSLRIERAICSKARSRVAATCFFGRSVDRAIVSINSALVIDEASCEFLYPNFARRHRRGRLNLIVDNPSID